MKKRQSVLWATLLSLVLILSISSCTRKVIDFTIVSTRNLSLEKLGTFLRDSQRTSGYDIKHVIIFVPLSQVNVKLAVDRAIDAIPGCVALVDCLVHSSGFWALLWGQTTMIAEGTPIIDPSLLDDELSAVYNQSDYLYVTLDKNGDIAEIKEIDKATYELEKAKVIKKKDKSYKISVQKG